MQARNVIVPFYDAPTLEELGAVVTGWQRPEMPKGLENFAPTFGTGYIARRSLPEIHTSRHKRQIEAKIISWLYDFIRANVKRGRVFDLGEVLKQGSADCIGYAKLFTLLGRLYGLDAGVIEIIMDNGGRYVPHTAALVRFKNHGLRFVDLWYGSKNIRHKRLGLQVKRAGTWRIEDLKLKELSRLEEVCYLPDACVDAITLYIQGNRHLATQEFDYAVNCYSEAIRLYPGNARFFYNRAIAYENLGEHQKADADYAQAFCNEAAVIRLLAREHDEVTSLLNLDARGIDNPTQDMYLLYKGFVTGKEVPLANVARRFGLSEKETRAILDSVEARVATD